MTNDPDLHNRGYFEDRYAGDPDPWGFDTRFYEQRKYDLTVGLLRRQVYRRGLEPGCANGALTVRLAGRCASLVSFDMLEDPVARARARLQSLPHVMVETGTFPDHWPSRGGDLVVWSEVAYYLRGDAADRAVTGLDDWLERGGDLVAVHYTGTTNYPRQGGEISAWLDGIGFLRRVALLVDEEFEAGVWTRP